MCIYIYEQYMVIFIFLFNATSSFSVQPQHIHFLRYMKRVACMGRGPASGLYGNNWGDEKKRQFLLGPMGVVFFFWGGKK